MSVRVRLWSAFAIVIVVIVSLITVGVVKSATYDLTVTQALADHLSADVPITVRGQVVGNSVAWEPSHEYLQFSIANTQGSSTLRVRYHGLRPDDFTNGWPVVVTGKIGSDGVLTATQLLIKCPSKYEAKS